MEGEVHVHGDRVGLPGKTRIEGEQAAQLGGEEEPAAGALGVDQRLLADAVAGDEEPPLLAIPDREGEHPPQLLHAALPHLLIEGQHHLRVRLRLEAVPSPLELHAQLEIVVDLAVEDHPQRPVGVREGLMPRRKVDDGQPAHREARGTVDVIALVVRAAVRDEVVGPLQQGLIGNATVAVNHAADSAHRAILAKRLC